MNIDSLLTMMAGLAGVLLVLWLIVNALRRIPALRGLMPPVLGRVHGSLAVGPRERVVLVEMGGDWMLLGVAAGRVNLLKTLDAEQVRRMQGSRDDAAGH
ncbi:MAG: flagellar biosynthetic protein FliO [Oceanococcaceae bacterium]